MVELYSSRRPNPRGCHHLSRMMKLHHRRFIADIITTRERARTIVGESWLNLRPKCWSVGIKSDFVEAPTEPEETLSACHR